MAEEDPTYYTRLDPETAEEVEQFRENNNFSKSEALRAIVDDWVAARDSGPFERAFFTLGVVSALLTLWFFFVGIMATGAVYISGFTRVSPQFVTGLFGMFAAAAFFTMMLSFVSQRYGLAALLDRRTVEEHQYLDP